MSSLTKHGYNMEYGADNDSTDVLKEKLQIKSESLLLLSQQLENSLKEKDEYKRLIDTLYDKNLTLKKKLYNDEQEKKNSSINKQTKQYSTVKSPSSKIDDIDAEEYIMIQKDLIKTLKKEKLDLIEKYEDTKQELNDCKLDLKLLREQLARQRNGTLNEGLINIKSDKLTPVMQITTTTTTTSITNDREQLIKEIELLKEKLLHLEDDLKLIICQKEEFELERDSYKSKFKQLNQFLLENSSLCVNKRDSNSSETQLESPKAAKMFNKDLLNINIDELISQNKYLTELNKSLKEEISLLISQLSKFKRSPNKQSTTQQPATTDMNENLMNKKDIKQLLSKSQEYLKLYAISTHSTSSPPSYPHNLSQFQINSLNLIYELTSVCDALLDNLNDKHIALQHQRKCNKLLAVRINDLENELKNYLNNVKVKNEIETDTLIKFDDDDYHNDETCNKKMSVNDEEKLCNLLNDLASKFKLNESIKKIKNEDADEDDDDDEVLSKVIASEIGSDNESLSLIKQKTIDLSEPFVLNT